VGKCCSNVLRSLRAYGFCPKPVRACVCEKNDTAHVRSSPCAISYTQTECEVMHTSMQTTRSTSVRRSAEAHEGISLGYTRFGDLLTVVLPYAVCVCVCLSVYGVGCVCVCVCVYIHMCVYIYIYMCVCIYTYTCVCVYTNICVCVCICVFVCIYMCVYVCV
jgi:hypothetical protein